jgi:hypothetical protein
MLRKDKSALRSRMSSFVDGFKGGAVQKPRRAPFADPKSEPNQYTQVNPRSVHGKKR